MNNFFSHEFSISSRRIISISSFKSDYDLWFPSFSGERLHAPIILLVPQLLSHPQLFSFMIFLPSIHEFVSWWKMLWFEKLYDENIIQVQAFAKSIFFSFFFFSFHLIFLFYVSNSIKLENILRKKCKRKFLVKNAKLIMKKIDSINLRSGIVKNCSLKLKHKISFVEKQRSKLEPPDKISSVSAAM